MRRRDFITPIGSAVAAWPLAARAQQPAMPVVGFLSSRSPGESAGVVAAFRQGFGESGFVEGQNVVIAFRWAEGHYDRLPALATELVDLHVAALFAAGGPPSALAAKAATSTIPVVFSAVNDPVRMGLVPSLNRPGGNVTGMSLLTYEMIGKMTQLLKEMVPAAAGIAYLVNPSSQAGRFMRGRCRRWRALSRSASLCSRPAQNTTWTRLSSPCGRSAPMRSSCRPNRCSTASVIAS
jgi:putative ABC transport system substrate-binding protein